MDYEEQPLKRTMPFECESCGYSHFVYAANSLPPTAYVTLRQVGDDVAHFFLDGDELFVTEGDPPDWATWTNCDYGQAEFPETTKAIEALLRAMRAERIVLGDPGYTCHTLGFSPNEHRVLENWVATRPEAGEYVVGGEFNPDGLTLSPFGLYETLRVVVHDDLYITRSR